jgi:hypothetical protein
MTTLRIESMRPGSYVVTALRLGYAVRTDTVDVGAAMEVTIALTMNDAYLGVRCSPPRYRRSGESACVGLEVPEAQVWVREARRYAEPRRDSDPWSRVQRVQVEKDESGWHWWLIDQQGYPIERTNVQLARLPGAESGAR